MFQKFQKYFKENNIRILLKYDGERENNLYTVFIYDKDLNECLLREDTDNPFVIFNNFILKLDICNDESLNKNYYHKFASIKKTIGDFLNPKMILLLSSEINDKKIEYRISVSLNKKNINFTCSNFTKLKNRIKRIKWDELRM